MLDRDIQGMIRLSSSLLGATGKATVNGETVVALPGIASIEDTVLGTEGLIAGNERTLRFSTVDVPGIKAGITLTWNETAWKVKHVQLMGQGHMTKVFLQEVR